MKKSEFLVAAKKLANDKARELGVLHRKQHWLRCPDAGRATREGVKFGGNRGVLPCGKCHSANPSGVL
jgi:hypothetical protein